MKNKKHCNIINDLYIIDIGIRKNKEIKFFLVIEEYMKMNIMKIKKKEKEFIIVKMETNVMVN